MVWNCFCTVREHSKAIFLLTSLFSLVQYRGRNSKKINFSKKNFEIVTWSELVFALWKSTKNDFFSDLIFLTFAVRRSKQWQKFDFLKKKLESSEIVKRSEWDFAL